MRKYKFLISALCFVATFILAIYLDGYLVDWFVSLFPKSAADWLGVIRFGAWFLVLWITLAVALILSYLVSSLVYIFLDTK